MRYLSLAILLIFGEIMIMEAYYKMLESFIPAKLKVQLKEKGSILEGVKYVVLSSLAIVGAISLYLLLFVIGFGLFFIFTGTLDRGLYLLLIFMGSIIAFLIAVPLLSVICSFLWCIIIFIFCKMLGGKGSFTGQYYHLAIIGGALNILTAISVGIPCLGRPVTMVLNLYYLYPSFLVYKKIHKLSDIRAGAVAVFPLLIGIILFILYLILVVFYTVLDVQQGMQQGVLT